MGLLTLERMEDRLQKILGNRGLTEPVLRDYVQLGYTEVVGHLEFESEKVCAHFLTTDGVSEYTLPENLLGVISVTRLGTTAERDRRLRRADLRNFAAMQRSTLTEVRRGAPEIWSRRRGAFLLWPTPDAEYRIDVYFYQEMPLLEEPTDTTIIPGSFDWSVICFAAYIGFAEHGEDATSDQWYQKGIIHMRSRKTDADYEQGTESLPAYFTRNERDVTSMRPLRR